MRTRGKKFASAEVSETISKWIDSEVDSRLSMASSRSEVVREALKHYIDYRERLKALQHTDNNQERDVKHE